MKKAIIVCMIGAVFLGIFIGVAHSGRVLFSTISPNQHYRVDITQSRSFPFDERAVFLNARRDGKPLVRRKLLYTGDFLDNDFKDLYPNPRFRSESVYELGSVELGNQGMRERSGDLRIINETSRDVAYILLETGWYKLVTFDIKAGAIVDLSFHYAGGLSFQGQFVNSEERFAGAVATEDKEDLGSRRQFVVTIKRDTATIESPQQGLRQAKCCASDRPDQITKGCTDPRAPVGVTSPLRSSYKRGCQEKIFPSPLWRPAGGLHPAPSPLWRGFLVLAALVRRVFPRRCQPQLSISR